MKMTRFILLLAISSLFNFIEATELTYTENDNTGNNLALGYPVPVPVDSQLPVEGFRSYQSLLDRHQDLALQSTNIAARTIGTTINNRQIWSFIYSDSDAVTVEGFPEPGTLHQGGIHAREWSTPEAVSGIMETLFENQNNQGLHQYLLQNMNMVFTPVLNVDGFLQTQRYATMAQQTSFINDPPNWPRDGRMRRKNMRNVDEILTTANDSLFGIDLNRNNAPFWATSAPNRSSDDNKSLTHHGLNAASEPEINAMQAAAALVPETRLRFYIDNHSFSQIYFTPLTNNSRRNAITTRVVNNMRLSNQSKYRYGPANAGSGIGSTDEYFAYTYQIPSYTLETEPLNDSTDYGGFGVSHDGFILPEAEVSRMKAEITRASLIGYYQQAGAPVVNAIEIRNANSQQIIFSGNWQRVNDSSREWIENINLDLVPGEQYQLWLSFNKPMRWLDNNGELGDYPNIPQDNSKNKITLVGLDNSNSQILQSLQIENSHWNMVAGGAPSGFSHYVGDALSITFTLDANLDASQLKLFAIEIEATDLARQSLDANPSTVLDWQQGAWSGYEDSEGNSTDQGGIDRAIRIINDGSPLFPVVTPPPPVIPPSSGGGGGSLWWMIIVLAFALLEKKRY